MKILAVDTSALTAAVAVMEDQRLLGEYLVNHKKTHSQKLMPMIDELLKGLELLPGDIDTFAVSIGPGSFTGLRIGVTTIKSLAYTFNRPTAGIYTLDALAANLFPAREELICPIMDARNNQVYAAVYGPGKYSPERLTEYMGVPVTELVKVIRSMERKVIFNGDAVKLHKDFLMSELGDRCSFAPGFLMLQRAASVAYLAFLKASAGELGSSFDLVPFYLRKSQAERERERKLAGVNNDV